MDYFDEKHIVKLKKLNSTYVENKKLERLKYIFNFSKNKFIENLKRYKKTKVKYILFGEAPPWTECGEPKYFYSKIESKLHKTFWETFLSYNVPADMSVAYQKLADKQFILIDSIPYALKYNGNVREKGIYQELIYEYVSTEVSEINKSIIFDENLKIAFAFRINGCAIIKTFGGNIEIANKVIHLDEHNISADGTGFPKSYKLKTIFELTEQ